MALSLKESQAVTELADKLYPFLPGKPHPYADQSLSFPGVAAKLRLAQYWPAGSKGSNEGIGVGPAALPFDAQLDSAEGVLRRRRVEFIKAGAEGQQRGDALDHRLEPAALFGGQGGVVAPVGLAVAEPFL